MRPLTPKESAVLAMLRECYEVVGLVRLAHRPDSMVYAVLSRDHRTQVGYDADGRSVWTSGRVLYLSLSLGHTYDRDAADFDARFTRVEEGRPVALYGENPPARPTDEAAAAERRALEEVYATLQGCAANLHLRDLGELEEPILGTALDVVRARLRALDAL